MALVLVNPSSELSDVRPHLMPFHINYTGEAPVSTYFIVKDSPVLSIPSHDASKHVPDNSSNASGAPPPAINTKPTYASAFRGRAMHGLEVSLPQGYTGLVLHTKDASTRSSTPTPVIPMKRKPGEDSIPGKLLQKKKGKGIPKTRSSAMDMDDSLDIPADDMYAFMSRADDDSSESPTLVGAGGASDNSMNRSLTPVSAFGSIVVWQPDMPVDEGRDEYIRAMDEWTRLANVVRGFHYFPDLCSLTSEQLHSV